jgi:hypothetical protein
MLHSAASHHRQERLVFVLGIVTDCYNGGLLENVELQTTVFVRRIALDVRDNKGCREANSIQAIIGYGNAEISKLVSSYLHRSGQESAW